MPNILTHLIKQQVAHYGREREAFSRIDIDNRRLLPTTWGEFADSVEAAACALEILGICPQDKVAVFSPNCPEIVVADFACYRNRAVPVSIYSTSSPEQVRYIIKDAGAKAIFVGGADHYAAVRSIAAECPGLEHVIIIEESVCKDSDDTRSMSFADLVALGASASAECRAEVELRASQAVPDDIATLIYTSGTTGEPKGAILPHSCFDAAVDMHKRRLDTISDEDTSVCFLPLSHIFEKAWTYFCLSMGMKVAINHNPKEIQKAVKIARPTCMCSVPRFWEKVYTAIQDKISDIKGARKIMIERALAVEIGRAHV